MRQKNYVQKMSILKNMYVPEILTLKNDKQRPSLSSLRLVVNEMKVSNRKYAQTTFGLDMTVCKIYLHLKKKVKYMINLNKS